MMDTDHQQRPGLSGYDAELRLHNEVLRRACGIQVRDRVLDIGCGAGQTTRQAARTAQAGSALGVDISAPAIERARELARAEGLPNVTFSRADAQVYRFPGERFDVAFSRVSPSSGSATWSWQASWTGSRAQAGCTCGDWTTARCGAPTSR